MAEEKKKKGLLGRAIDKLTNRDEKEAAEKAMAEAAEKERIAEAAKKAAEEAKKKQAREEAEAARKKEMQARKEMFEARRRAMQVAKPNVIAEHTVGEGETLSHISLKHYGSAVRKYWELIYEANVDVIGDDYNIIRVGDVLLIPELPEDMKK